MPNYFAQIEKFIFVFNDISIRYNGGWIDGIQGHFSIILAQLAKFVSRTTN